MKPDLGTLGWEEHGAGILGFPLHLWGVVCRMGGRALRKKLENALQWVGEAGKARLGLCPQAPMGAQDQASLAC